MICNAHTLTGKRTSRTHSRTIAARTYSTVWHVHVLAFGPGPGTSLVRLSPAQRTNIEAAHSETSFYHNSASNESRMRRLALQTWLMLELCAVVRPTNVELRKTWPEPGVSRWRRAHGARLVSQTLVSTDVSSKMRPDPPLASSLLPISLISSTSLSYYSRHRMQQNQWKENEALVGPTLISLQQLYHAACVRNQVLVRSKWSGMFW